MSPMVDGFKGGGGRSVKEGNVLDIHFLKIDLLLPRELVWGLIIKDNNMRGDVEK